MADETIKLPIRSALIPNFYRNFHCLMGACQDNCCDDGWRIYFDKKDYLRVKRATEKDPELRDMIAQGMRRLREQANDTMYAEFCLTGEKRCAFHTKEGLCRLQLECGEETLPEVCRTYPRRVDYTPAAKEYCLSPSCEGVLQQLWELPDGIEFVEEPLPKAERRDVTILQDKNLLHCFTPIRALCIDILQNRAMPLTERMLCLGLVLQQLQKEDWTAFDPDRWTERMALLSGTEEFSEVTGKIAGNRDMFLLQNVKVLNAIANKWPQEIFRALDVKQEITVNPQDRTTGKLSVKYSKPAYESALERFQAAFADRAYFFENLMVAAALYLNFPSLSSKEELWKSYVSLCNLYSFYRFVSVLGCKEDTSKERLFHMIVMASRATLHNRDRLNSFQEDLFQHDSSSLAHMAILLNG